MPECVVCGLVTSSSSCPVCGSAPSDELEISQPPTFGDSENGNTLPFGLDTETEGSRHSSIPFGLEKTPEKTETNILAFGLDNSPLEGETGGQKALTSEQSGDKSTNRLLFGLPHSPLNDE